MKFTFEDTFTPADILGRTAIHKFLYDVNGTIKPFNEIKEGDIIVLVPARLRYDDEIEVHTVIYMNKEEQCFFTEMLFWETLGDTRMIQKGLRNIMKLLE